MLETRRFEPAWSAKMGAKLKDIDLPRNVRLMIFQFALNAPVSTALLPWAVPWIKAMADFALAPLPEGRPTITAKHMRRAEGGACCCRLCGPCLRKSR